MEQTNNNDPLIVSKYARKQIRHRQAGWDAFKSGLSIVNAPRAGRERVEWETGWQNAKQGLQRPGR